MRVVSVVGARPQFVKLGPISNAMAEGHVDHVIVHTGQHYDPAMSDSFFRDLGIPDPAFHLGVGSGTHGVQTGRILAELDPVIAKLAPDWVLAYGDTNSTIAAALCAVKLHVPLAHLEAGLRSFNRRMPEEHNRVLTDHAADLCLAPTEIAAANLAAEGLQDRVVVTGDVMTDVCLNVWDPARASRELRDFGLEDSEFILATIHRPDNTDDFDRLAQIIYELSALPQQVVLPAHPRLRSKAQEGEIKLDPAGITLVDPLSYPQLISLAGRAKFVVTDSGGLQKEAFLLRTPCFTVRPETEWVETVELGWNTLVPDPRELRWRLNAYSPIDTSATPYGTGGSAHLVVQALAEAMA